MSKLISYCQKKFPKNWDILEKGKGLFQIRDNLIVRGEGYYVNVQEELNRYEVEIVFEDFAKDLSIKAESTISKVDSPLKRILDQILTPDTQLRCLRSNLQMESIAQSQ